MKAQSLPSECEGYPSVRGNVGPRSATTARRGFFWNLRLNQGNAPRRELENLKAIDSLRAETTETTSRMGANPPASSNLTIGGTMVKNPVLCLAYSTSAFKEHLR